MASTPTVATPLEGQALVATNIANEGHISWGFQGENNRIISATGTSALTVQDQVVQASAATGNITLTLPPAASFNRTLKTFKVDSSTFTVSVAPTGSDTINGTTTDISTTTQWGIKNFYSDGVSNWIQY